MISECNTIWHTAYLLTAKHDSIMMGNAIYRPTSNASALPPAILSASPEAAPAPMRVPGTIPPRVAALISSSDASHDFIFSSRLLADADDADDIDATDVLIVSSSASVPMNNCTSGLLCKMIELLLLLMMLLLMLMREEDRLWGTALRDDISAEGEKEFDTCTMAAMISSSNRRIMVSMFGCTLSVPSSGRMAKGDRQRWGMRNEEMRNEDAWSSVIMMQREEKRRVSKNGGKNLWYSFLTHITLW